MHVKRTFVVTYFWTPLPASAFAKLDLNAAVLILCVISGLHTNIWSWGQNSNVNWLLSESFSSNSNFTEKCGYQAKLCNKYRESVNCVIS